MQTFEKKVTPLILSTRAFKLFFGRVIAFALLMPPLAWLQQPCLNIFYSVKAPLGIRQNPEIGGFPIKIKTKIRQHHMICCYHNFTL